MSRIRQIRAIAFKELIDYIRDWRTLLAIVLVPLLLFPLLFVALPLLLQAEYVERQEFDLQVIIQTNDDVENLKPFLFDTDMELNWEVAQLLKLLYQ